MFKSFLRVVLVLVSGLFFSFVGLFIGAMYGGNYATQFMFNGVQGYEATGLVGMYIGAVVGLALGWWFPFKRKKLHQG